MTAKFVMMVDPIIQNIASAGSSVRSIPTDLDPRKPIISLSRVSKQYRNGTLALEQVSLSIYEGEFLSLLGPSGCGKSTILQLLAKLSDPSSGKIDRFAPGRQGTSAQTADMGFVFQEPTLLPWTNVFENVAIPLRLWRRPETEIRGEVARVLGMVGLEAFAKAYPRELSGGMKMRVSIARALVTRPPILLMDEPFAALDEFTRQKLDDDLIEIRQKTGCTIVFVTHSTSESVYLSTRIAVMAARPGRLIGEIPVPAEYPRGRKFRLSPTFAQTAEAVSDLLEFGRDQSHR